MNFYELTYLTIPEIEETKLRELREKIISLINKEGGILHEINLPKKIKLAYPIKKRTEGFLADLTFFIFPQKIKNLDREIKKIPEIMRFLIIKKKTTIKKPEVEIEEILPEKEEKVSLKELDEKLKEILKEEDLKL